MVSITCKCLCRLYNFYEHINRKNAHQLKINTTMQHNFHLQNVYFYYTHEWYVS